MLLGITAGSTHNTDLPGQMGFGGGLSAINVPAAVSNVHGTCRDTVSTVCLLLGLGVQREVAHEYSLSVASNGELHLVSSV